MNGANASRSRAALFPAAEPSFLNGNSRDDGDWKKDGLGVLGREEEGVERTLRRGADLAAGEAKEWDLAER